MLNNFLSIEIWAIRLSTATDPGGLAWNGPLPCQRPCHFADEVLEFLDEYDIQLVH